VTGTGLPADAVGTALIEMVALLLLIRFLDVWEREPFWLVLLFVAWGGLFAVSIAAPINDARLAALSPDLRAVWGAALVGPTDEEPIKGLALVLAYVISRIRARSGGTGDFDGPLDGLVFGAAIGLGFGFVEDLSYGSAYGVGVLHLRLGFLGLGLLGHAVYTGAFGAGLGLATWSRTHLGRIGWPVLGLAVAIFLHFVHNGLMSFFLVTKFGLHTTAAAIDGTALPAGLIGQLQSTEAEAFTVLQVFDYGTIAAFFIAFAYWLRYQRNVLVMELAEEAQLGVIDSQESELITRYGARVRMYWQLLMRGQLVDLYRVRKRHQLITELAFGKWRVSRISGPHGANERQRIRVRQLRERLAPAGTEAAAHPTPVHVGPHPNDERNSLILGIAGLALGLLLLPLVASVTAIWLGFRALRGGATHHVPAGLILGLLSLIIWVPVYVIALTSSP
jgi:RsiW-degrading membrane proteinase PrsW (M82 family)